MAKIRNLYRIGCKCPKKKLTVVVANWKTVVSLTYKPTTKPQKAMNILIAKANEQLIQSICPAKKINFHQMNRAGRFGNTSYFKLTKPQFDKLYKEIIAAGYNPFALLTW